MSSLASILSEMVGDAFAALDLPRELGAVRVSDRPDLCQFQCNGAMGAAKLARKNPREVAAAIVEALSGGAGLAKVEVAGPGFINIDVTEEFLAQTLGEISSTPKLGVEEINDAPSVVLDYGGPNIAKAMHVGHLRSSIIGDTLRRIYAFAGYRTIGDVHMGDWGTPMGMILSELEISGFSGEITMEYLANIYPKAAQACKDDAARMEAARAATKRLQNGDVAATSTWQKFIDVSIEGMKKNFDALGVHFDEWKGESDAHPYIAPMVEDLKARNIVVESEGALIVPVEREDDKKDVPPLILLKSDGAVLYGTTDLATIVERVESHNPLKIIYIVDQRQGLHFEQVFRAAEKSGIVKDDKPELIHAGFGTMNGTDGKPFKTRAGGVMRLEDLIEMGMDRARVRLAEANLDAEIGADEREDIAQKVAIAAIKFADLQNQRQSDYVFDLDRMTAFEGKTGPYLLYQAVRIQSLLRKAGEIDEGAALKIYDADRSLALMLGEFSDHFDTALRNNTPHVLCDYAHRLAQEFSSFYANCHILSEGDGGLRASRLRLCAMTHKMIVTILDLLGISVPERM